MRDTCCESKLTHCRVVMDGVGASLPRGTFVSGRNVPAEVCTPNIKQ